MAGLVRWWCRFIGSVRCGACVRSAERARALQSAPFWALALITGLIKSRVDDVVAVATASRPDDAACFCPAEAHQSLKGAPDF
jgi:hypothetical protein